MKSSNAAHHFLLLASTSTNVMTLWQACFHIEPDDHPSTEPFVATQPPDCRMPRQPNPSPLKPRRAPSQPRSERMVATLLEAAAQVLETKGLEGFNTNAVAERAGVSIGSLYQYFPSKDALTIALMQRENERFYRDALVALDHPGGPVALTHLIGVSVRQQFARPMLARLLDVEESRPQLRMALASTGSVRSVLLEVLVRDGLPPQEDVAVAASDLMAIVRGLVDAAGEREETDTTGLTRRVTAAVLGYLTMMSSAGHNDDSSAADTPQPVSKREQAVRKAGSRGLKRP
ncbi:TetR/AcrR family transcriptional regulator [Paraburkholderia sediminicola]|uniref:TetR/AcrR family transcriptional regulator n=1 Tax=Paraburkholderia sediminicola TaxID=458836 RepID=UPI0038BA5221